MSHVWTPTVLRPAHLVTKQPAVMWWPHCSACGAQVCSAGKNLFYRATSAHEWVSSEPPCASPSRGDSEGEKR